MIYDIMQSELGPILFSRNEKGLNRLHFLDSDKPFVQSEKWQKNSRDSLLKDAREQLEAYFSRELREFSLPLSLEGTSFQVRVWKALATIPYGETWSYKELASAIGNPKACRAVGNANGKNKIPIILP